MSCPIDRKDTQWTILTQNSKGLFTPKREREWRRQRWCCLCHSYQSFAARVATTLMLKFGPIPSENADDLCEVSLKRVQTIQDVGTEILNLVSPTLEIIFQNGQLEVWYDLLQIVWESCLRANADRAKATSLFGLGCHSINLCSPSKRFCFRSIRSRIDWKSNMNFLLSLSLGLRRLLHGCLFSSHSNPTYSWKCYRFHQSRQKEAVTDPRFSIGKGLWGVPAP